MSYAEEIRRQAEDAPRAALPTVTAALWRTYADGKITDAEAEALSGLIEARTARAPRWGTNTPRGGISDPQADVGKSDNASAEGCATWHTPQGHQSSPRRPGVGSRPRTDASLERRRRWAASGRLPPGLAARFTLAEQAVLALVAAEHARRKDCRLAVGHIAAVAGVSETTVRNAIREARQLGLVTVEERPITGFRNLPNVVRIVSPEWTTWLRLARRSSIPSLPKGGGCKSPNRTPTQVQHLVASWPAETSKGLPKTAVDLGRSASPRNRTGGGTGRAMR